MGTYYDYALIGDEVLVWWMNQDGAIERQHLAAEAAASFIKFVEGLETAIQTKLREGLRA